MPEDAFIEIANAITMLRRAFMRAGLRPPKAIELETHEDGDRLRLSLPRDMLVAEPRMTDRGPQWVCSIVGLDIHYPGQWRARERGGIDFV